MDIEEDFLLSLFDFYWFQHKILHQNPPAKQVLVAQESSKPSLLLQRGTHRRSSSDSLTPATPDDVYRSSRQLETIFSGKETKPIIINPTVDNTETEVRVVLKRRGNRRNQKDKNKSLSELEFEELRGMMDLGFNFNESELDSRILTIVPALRRRSSTPGDELATATTAAIAAEEGLSLPTSDETAAVKETDVVRPYLSEAWDELEDNMLKNWRIPALGAGVDMTDHLKLWARVVADSVR